ncbi:MAG: hypothetical protein MK000_08350, partial [Anaerolineales bacterium]|nr:hypothetical protein [Anaerolineales bacterium]
PLSKSMANTELCRSSPWDRVCHCVPGLSWGWLDYVIPHAQHTAETLEIVLVEVPSEHGPFGARGVGEPPIVATAAAVANAIADATGIRPNALPIRPSQLLSALKDAQNLG